MVKEFFKELDSRWDKMMEPDTIKKMEEIVTDSHLLKGMRVLDVACGTGIFTAIIHEAVGEQGTVTGIDYAPEMIKQAKLKRMGENVNFFVADVMRLPFADASFDIVFCNGATPHFDDVSAALLEMQRVLIPAGSLVVCHDNGRKAINEIHQKIGKPILEHLLPTAVELKRTLEFVGYMVIEYEVLPDHFVFRAEKAAYK